MTSSLGIFGRCRTEQQNSPSIRYMNLRMACTPLLVLKEWG